MLVLSLYKCSCASTI